MNINHLSLFRRIHFQKNWQSTSSQCVIFFLPSPHLSFRSVQSSGRTLWWILSQNAWQCWTSTVLYIPPNWAQMSVLLQVLNISSTFSFIDWWNACLNSPDFDAKTRFKQLYCNYITMHIIFIPWHMPVSYTCSQC